MAANCCVEVVVSMLQRRPVECAVAIDSDFDMIQMACMTGLNSIMIKLISFLCSSVHFFILVLEITVGLHCMCFVVNQMGEMSCLTFWI